MLIFPIENKPDWSRPPWMTLLLILLNVLVFVLYQSRDEAKMELAYDVYQESRLLEWEKAHYLDFLQESDKDFLGSPEVIEALEQDEDWLVYNLIHDLAFDAYLREQWAEDPPEDLATWRSARLVFEQQRDRMSLMAAGLVPAQVTDKPWTLITSQFLHADIWHLLGNMVFLFIFGFALETVLRPWLYLLMYLATGLAAGGLYLLFNTEPYIGLVGASGAVSGLMGMYIALYRLRRIRFFYALGFYFGEFTAPALWVFPFWVAKELYGQFYTDTNIAYWAHIGGLLAGAALMWLVPGTQQTLREKSEDDESEQAIQAALAQIQRQTAELNIVRARGLAQNLCHRFPADPRPWQALFDLHKRTPASREFHQVTFSLLKHWASDDTLPDSWRPLVNNVIKEYQALAPSTPALTAPLCLALARRWLRDKQYRQAEALVARAAGKKAPAAAQLRLIKTLYREYQAMGKQAAARRMAERARQLQPLKPDSA